MKKYIVALALAGGAAAFAYASLHNSKSEKQAIEKQQKQEVKKECKKDACLADANAPLDTVSYAG